MYTSLVDACNNAVIRPMPNHHVDSVGEVQGFRFTCNDAERSLCIPFGRRMFQRYSMVECVDDINSHENNRILQLLIQQNKLKDKLVQIVQKIYHESINNEASLEKMPDNCDILEEGYDLGRAINSYYVRKSADAEVRTT